MAQNKQLNKPKFVKIKDLQTHRSGFNVYAKVVSAEPKTIDTKEGLKIPMVECVVADETGSAKAFFKGDNAKLIQKGNVIAIRNGLKRFIKDKISLEVDLFGRVTLEKDVIVNANEEQTANISNVEHKLERRDRRQGGRKPQGERGGPRRDNDRPRREDDRPRREDDRPRREDDRPRREDDRPRRNDDRPRRNDDRPRRNEDRPRRDRQNQDRFDNRREEVPRRRYDRDYDRRGDRNERGGEREERRYREDRRPREDRTRQYAEKREGDNRGERKPIRWTKLADISPADDGLNLQVKVLSVTKIGGRSTKYRCVIADSTGCAKAFLPDKIEVREGDSIVLFNANAEVVSEHIEIQLNYREGRIEQSRRPIDKINEEFDLSAKAWVPIE